MTNNSGYSVKYFDIELLEDVILSETGATTGGSSLDYVSGGVILGLIASKLYKKYDSEKAWSIFHSGQLRFTNAYPLIDGGASLPIPLSWHSAKNDSDRSAKKKKSKDFSELDFENIITGSFDEDQPDIQQKQIRVGYFSKTGLYQKLTLVRRQKTAIDRNRLGQARDGHFFGLTAIPRKSKFRFSIEVDNNIDNKIAKEISEALTSSEHFIGRSRSAEFGRCKVSVADNQNDFIKNEIIEAGSTKVIIYCSSDIILKNESGEITAEEFGLPKNWGSISKDSYSRRRRFALYNQHRHSFSTEHDVVVKGSVLIFEGKALSDKQTKDFQTDISNNVGLNRAQGYGKLAVGYSKEFDSFSKYLETDKSKALETDNKVAEPDDELFQWAQDRANDSELNYYANNYAAEREKYFEALLKQLARKAKNEGKAISEIAPSKSQWGNVRNIINTSKSAKGLRKSLFDNEKGMLVKGVAKENWAKEVDVDQKHWDVSALKALEEFLSDEQVKKFFPEEKAKYLDQFIRKSALEIVNRVRKIMDRLERQGGQK